MMNEPEVTKVFIQNDLTWGRLLSYSKSEYRAQNPESDVLFNANIYILGVGKVWWGDIDLTKDWNTLETVAASLGRALYVLREMDGRFGKEDQPDEQIIALAHAEIRP